MSHYTDHYTPDQYLVLQNADVISDGAVGTVLSDLGFPGLSVCPHCRVDDFTHVEGCDLTWSEQ